MKNDKVWLVILDWCFDGESEYEITPCASRLTAIETLNKKIQEENKNSWISEYSHDEFDEYTLENDYFDVQMGSWRTTIYIQEKEILK